MYTFGAVIGAVVLVVAIMLIAPWLLMLIAGTLAGLHGFYSPGFGEVLLAWLGWTILLGPLTSRLNK